ncbi:MAG TPA: 50S ribosomal protein L21e [Acidobacteriota bacterium]|nr:50S ribosomal protein L21e [Acidobacteriota bacterium]
MAMRMGGSRRKTSHMFSNPLNKRGKLSIRRFLQGLNVGEKVVLKSQPTYQQGMYFRRFHGKIGTVLGKQGDCYLVEVDNFDTKKTILVHPAHVKKQ